MKFVLQQGPQYRAGACTADVCFYGGAAGGGKTIYLLLEPTRYVTKVPGFRGVIFRRTMPQIMNAGGLWDEAGKIYPYVGGMQRLKDASYNWPATNASIKFSHLQYDTDVINWQGTQIDYLGFDELTHFSRKQFFYMLSRIRSGTGINGYVRATMNPDPDHFAREFVDWYIDKDTGLPIPERCGVVRYFAREKDDKLVWADERETLTMLGLRPMSFTFIAAKLIDNPILVRNNPNYETFLDSLSVVDRARLRDANWNMRATQGTMFRPREWCELIQAAPVRGRTIRYWDRAASEPGAGNTNPDWTRGLKAMRPAGSDKTVLLDMASCRLRAEGVMQLIARTCAADGPNVEQWLETDPGQAGLAEMNAYRKEKSLQNKPLYFYRPTGNKVQRAKIPSAEMEGGRVQVVDGPWVEEYYKELEGFADWDNMPDETKPRPLPKDDQVDVTSGACAILVSGGTGPSITSLA